MAIEEVMVVWIPRGPWESERRVSEPSWEHGWEAAGRCGVRT